MEKKVLIQYNLLRLAAIFLVISTHMLSGVWIAEPGSNTMGWHLREIVRTLTLSCNGLFFMLSGRFILEKPKGNIPSFYWDRFVKIGIPVLAAAFLYYAQLHGLSFHLAYWKDFAKAFLQVQIAGYLWFVMALAGFYLAAPFLARMFSAMTQKELWQLLLGALFYFFLQTMYGIFSLEAPMEGYAFANWGFYCILGFLLDRLELTEDQYRGFLCAGILGVFLISVQEIWFTGRNPLLYSFAPSMILLCSGIYLFVTRRQHEGSRRFQGIINGLSRYIFFIYLFHGLTHNLIFEFLGDFVPAGYGFWLFLSLLSFLMALGLSVPAYHLLYRPLCRVLLRKKPA